MISGIYIIQNTLNQKIYIGSAVDLFSRKSKHFSDLKFNVHKNPHLQLSYNKYGEDNFKFWIAELVPDINQLLICEQWWLDMFKPYNNKTGYNICKKAGSQLGTKRSLESRKKMAAWQIGRQLSLETKQKISAGLYLTMNTPETILKLKNRPNKRNNTHCFHGHEYTKENTYNWPKHPQYRLCKTCQKISHKKNYGSK